MSITSYPELVTLSQSNGGNTVDFAATKTDAFNRLRVSSPLTLFDSSHRFADNDLWVEDTTGTASSTFSQDEGLIDMDVGTASGDEIIRETTKVFSYQPGKSLLVLNTFVFDEAKTNLRQRVGYFGTSNGMYLEQTDTTVNFVERSLVTGSVTETRVAQANWNIDRLDGTGPSGITLDLSKAQILWMDIEWLGLGSVRIGFIIDGQFILCHTFHHANLITSTYITTASLPLRYEITNTGTTSSSSTLKQICSTVISEGGYELRGRQQAVGTPITDTYNLATAGTYYPIVSIRLKSARLDAIVILTALSALPTENGDFNWRVVAGGSTTAGSWVSAGANSSVEYNLTGTATSGGRVLASGFVKSSNTTGSGVDILKEALFKFQLERNTFTSTAEELSLVMASNGNNDEVYGSLDWEEVTR
tara:strand:+ start:75 stop:1331 length:1257 start_codon:yes stop_codon:yes gene_type:complete